MGGHLYNHEGELIAVDNEDGEQHLLHRDPTGLLVGERTFDGRELRYHNDLLGRTIRVENGAREVTELSYDAAGQLVARQLDDGKSESFAYNRRGELVRAENAAGSYQFERDPAGRIVREAQTVGGETHWVAVSYDGEGERLGRRTSLGHTEQIDRDALGARARTLLDGQHWLAHASDALGREVTRLLPAGGRIETGFDALGRVARRRSLDRTAAAPTPTGQPEWLGPSARGITVDTAYRYSPDGELVEALDQARGKTAYRYDPVGQLLAMVPEKAREELFRFDPRGNLHEADPGASGRVYGKGNRLLQKGDTRYRWDDDGRLIEKRTPRPGEADEVWRYGWDAAGLLKEVERPDGVAVRFRYDPFARRVSKEVLEPRPGGQHARLSRTRFVWDGDVLAHELREAASQSGDPVVEERTYLYEDDSFEPMAHREAGRWVHYVNDPIGTPERLLEGGGQVACELRRSAWGKTEVLPGARATTPVRFQGQYEDDETGLAYNRWRYYDGEAAGFTTRDPIGIVGNYNCFATAPNLLSWIDPHGLVASGNEGIYELPVVDPKTGEVQKYHGQSDDVDRRYREHVNDPNKTLAHGPPRVTRMPGSTKEEREVAEHEAIQKTTQGVAARRCSDVANKRDPIGKSRRKRLKMADPK